MNVLLWVLQGALALLFFAGGAYKVLGVDELARRVRPPSRSGWRALGVLEMVGAVLLVVPVATGWPTPASTPLAAAVLALETLALAGLYARHSLRLTVANPLVWAVAMGLLVAFVAYAHRAAWTAGG